MKSDRRTDGDAPLAGVGVTVLAILAFLAIILVVTGCGGSSSGATGSTSGTSAEAGSTESSSSGSDGSSAPAAGFSKKAKQASFGEESSDEEREQASELLERNLSARDAGNFEEQCETFSAPVVKVIEEGGNSAIGGKKSCAEILEAEAEKAPPGLLENNMVGPISALRIKGNEGYAVYHGTKNQDYAMKMEKENGEWLVGAALTETLPQG